MAKWAVLALFFLVISQVSASYIYGDIYIDEKGNSEFFLETDMLLDYNGLDFDGANIKGKSYDFSFKQGDNWTFSLGLGEYDDILIDIHLPKNLKSISSINGVERVVDFDEKIITLIDQNKKLDFSVKYNLKENKNYSLFYFLIVLVFGFGVSYVVFKISRKKRKIKEVFPFINENEQKIIEVLMKGPMRQKQVREHINVPKASFTRYLINLERKRLLIREGEGKNKVLKLR